MLSAASLLAGLVAPGLVAAQSTATYTYDALGRVVGTSYPSGASTVYEYDLADNRKRVASNLVVCSPPMPQNSTATVPYNSTNAALTLINTGGPPTGLQITSPPLATAGTATVSGAAIFYTPVAGSLASASLAYTATGCGVTNGPATVSISVQAPPAPTASPANIGAIAYHGSGSVGLSASGSVTQLLVSSNPANGAASISGTTATYNSTGASGPDVFYYIARGPGGDSAPARVDVNVNAAPSAVVANPDSLVIPVYEYWNGQTIIFNWDGCVNVLANDTGQNLTLTSVSPADYISSWAPNGQVCFSTDSNSSILYTYTYTVSGTGGSASNTISLTLSY
jgi:YD repeat-containing protein